jgi:YVTN family beta-propeller protein
MIRSHLLAPFALVAITLAGSVVSATASPTLPIAERIPVGGRSAAIAVGDDAVWVAVFTGNTSGDVVRIDPASAKVTARIPGTEASGLALGHDAVWVSDELRGRVTRIDPRSNTIVARVRVPQGPHGIAVGAGAVWVADMSGGGAFGPGRRTCCLGSIVRIDPHGNRTRVIPTGRETQRVAVGYGSVWATNTGDGTVSRIDPRTNRVIETIHVAGCPVGITVGAGAVWVDHCNPTDQDQQGKVTEIDPRSSRQTAQVAVGKEPNGLAVVRGLIWVTNQQDDTITRIDPRTARIVDTLAEPTGPQRFAPGPDALALGAGGVWISNNGDGTVTRVDLDKLRP